MMSTVFPLQDLDVLQGRVSRGRRGSMKFHTEYLSMHTKTKRAYIHLTPQVESALKKSGIKDVMILVSAMHRRQNRLQEVHLQ